MIENATKSNVRIGIGLRISVVESAAIGARELSLATLWQSAGGGAD
jgi:hypothetical protein